ncbi:MAG: spore coat protein CotJB [Defluviitaleaceae bacterium]|nr:spore coat protein CotJB [Defluviitaleaceae bacterium]
METQNHHHGNQHWHERDALLRRLTELDFMLVDLAMFLNTHPGEAAAVEEYNKVVCEADKVRSGYEKLVGPLCSFRSKNNAPTWIWPDEPWPWSREGNFSITEGEAR